MGQCGYHHVSCREWNGDCGLPRDKRCQKPFRLERQRGSWRQDAGEWIPNRHLEIWQRGESDVLLIGGRTYLGNTRNG